MPLQAHNPMSDLVADLYTNSRSREADQHELFGIACNIAEDEGVAMVLDGMPEEYREDFKSYLLWLAEGIPKGEIFHHNLKPVSLETVKLLMLEAQRRRW